MGPAGCESRPQEKSFRVAQCSKEKTLVLLGLKRCSVKHPGRESARDERASAVAWQVPLAAPGACKYSQRRVPGKRQQPVPAASAPQAQGWQRSPCPVPLGWALCGRGCPGSSLRAGSKELQVVARLCGTGGSPEPHQSSLTGGLEAR